MKSLLRLLWILLLTAAAASAVRAADLPAARVYLSPDPDSQVIGLMPQGQPLEVLALLGEYYRIDCGAGTVGYLPVSQVRQEAPGDYRVSLPPEDPDTVSVPTLDALELARLRQQVLRCAEDQLGQPYVYGGHSPGGFDCSGLMEYIFCASGFSIPRTADPQLASGLILQPEELRCGDLIFFSRTDGTEDFISHVGLCIGGGEFLHAGSGGVCIRSYLEDYYAAHFVAARRILVAGTLPAAGNHYLAIN